MFFNNNFYNHPNGCFPISFWHALRSLTKNGAVIGSRTRDLSLTMTLSRKMEALFALFRGNSLRGAFLGNVAKGVQPGWLKSGVRLV
ncbi:hypothetical protein COB57_05635 [Candidatus Peregrinibacteria bacterium]|nr:MAG: hypothetical protein COB57_05635 [Candidatus Peregrinibacteria bacterium]